MRLGTAADVAAALCCSTRHVRRLERAGQLLAPRVPVPGLDVRYDLDTLDAELARLRDRAARSALALVAGASR
jgi:predicted alpha/beta-hydrolase family hydrolase